MNEKSSSSQNAPSSDRGLAWESDPFLATVPQSVRDHVEAYARHREPGRRALIEGLERENAERLREYDEATRSWQSDLLQVYEMSLQTRPRLARLRDAASNERDQDRGREK